MKQLFLFMFASGLSKPDDYSNIMIGKKNKEVAQYEL